jgi:transformation/transcription domain-associated protein
MNLADAAKLTVDSLDGLARLLSLLTNYFKVEIATKLVDHFKALATEDVLREAAYGPMVDNPTISKLVRLLNIFHLLPPAANVYLEQVMTLVVTAETKIHAASPTLFTPPISAYLNRFPIDGITILFDHLKEIRWVQTFRHVIQAGKAPDFVTELKRRGSELAQAVERAENGHAGVPHILLCQDLAEADPEWMASQEDILDALKIVWAVTFEGTVDESGFTSARLILIRAIFKIWIEVLKVRPRVDLLLSLCLIFTRPVEINYSEVIEFVSVYMANNASLSFKHEAVQYFVTTLDEESGADYQLLQYLRVVVIPLLTAEFRQAESLDDVVRDGLMVKVWEKVWTQGASIEWSADFAAELLQLTGILVTNAFSKIGTEIPRGAVAKYIWDLLKAPDSMVRNTAHLTAARFFANKEVANDKFQGSLWSALLKAPQDGETSAVARQALDIMTPVMTRLPAAEMTLKWDAVICRTLSEEQNNISTTIHTYRLVLRHADHCYQSREIFIPQFVHGLNKLGFNAGHTPETRGLALDLIDLIFEWQRRSSDEQKSAMAVDSTPPSSRWVMPTQLKDSIANFLIRLSLNSVDTFQKPTLNLRYLMQLKTLFSSEDWSEVSIRLSFFSRAFEMVSSDPLISSCCIA